MITALEKVALEVSSRAMRKHLFRHMTLDTRINADDWRDQIFIGGLAQAQLFDVDNVLHWLRAMELPSDDALFKLVAELPTCVPPYPYTYLEWHDILSELDSERTSAYVIYTSNSNPEAGGGAALITMFQSSHRVSNYVLCLGTLYVEFDAEGRVLALPENPQMPRIGIDMTQHVRDDLVPLDPDLAERFHQIAGQTAIMALFVFSLLHCTNVKAVEVDPRATMSRQQIRNFERQGRKFLTYNVVEVKPFGSYKRGTGEPQGEGRRKRLHHVRGHFVEYGEEFGKGKLFGKYEGRFYVPPHIRGDLHEGTVAKTYKLGRPTGKEDLSQYRR